MKPLSLKISNTPIAMNTVTLRKELQEYIDKADDRFIKLIYGMMSADREETLEVPESHKKVIRERLAAYQKNPENVLSWEEVQRNIES